ncbi:MAG: SDR family oxidoreductase [Saprospiraceae bacterium]|nr:SDR family oxidoreductase [Saprospiraceae bacterium]
MTDFNNQTVWITGASAGIGKELALQMAKGGAKIILTARNTEKLNAVKDSLAGNGHIVYPMDLLKVDTIPNAVEEVLAKVEAIDILVNNAGISQRSLAKDTLMEVDRKIMELDYFAAISLTKSVLPHMTKRKAGLIITISSIAGKFGTPMRTAYCAAKHAVIGFMDALRSEVHADNIKVMVVTPGSVKTNISINALEGDGKKHNVTDPLIENGIPVDECAAKIISGIRNGTPEVLIAKGKEKLAVYVKRFFPTLLFKMMTKLKAT